MQTTMMTKIVAQTGALLMKQTPLAITVSKLIVLGGVTRAAAMPESELLRNLTRSGLANSV